MRQPKHRYFFSHPAPLHRWTRWLSIAGYSKHLICHFWNDNSDTSVEKGTQSSSLCARAIQLGVEREFEKWKLSLVLHLKCPYHQNFPIWSYISCNELLRKNFSIGMKAIFLWTFKNLKILFSCGRSVPLITASTCSELWRTFRNVRPQAWLISLVLPL